MRGWRASCVAAASVGHSPRRARIVLACAESGSTDTGIARSLGVGRPSVTTWRARFLVHRLDGVVDVPCPGAPRAVADTAIGGMITRTLESQPENANPGRRAPWPGGPA